MKEQEKQLRDFIGDSVKYDDNGTMIFGVKNGDIQLIADVRGWGAIQNLPQFKNDKTQDNMAEFQDALGQFIADAINEKLTNSNRDNFAIEFKDWCDKLSFMDKVTVHPIAGSGGSSGPRELTNSELLETYLRKLFHSQKQTQG